jgi:phosphatidylserine/phosphatidylglycerophosphate/cardiolipin synthase-like enzyme
MRLIVLPEDGVVPIVSGIRAAKKTLDMPIFRLDHIEVDKAIKSAVKRGVVVRTLIAHNEQQRWQEPAPARATSPRDGRLPSRAPPTISSGTTTSS